MPLPRPMQLPQLSDEAHQPAADAHRCMCCNMHHCPVRTLLKKHRECELQTDVGEHGWQRKSAVPALVPKQSKERRRRRRKTCPCFVADVETEGAKQEVLGQEPVARICARASALPPCTPKLRRSGLSELETLAQSNCTLPANVGRRGSTGSLSLSANPSMPTRSNICTPSDAPPIRGVTTAERKLRRGGDVGGLNGMPRAHRPSGQVGVWLEKRELQRQQELQHSLPATIKGATSAMLRVRQVASSGSKRQHEALRKGWVDKYLTAVEAAGAITQPSLTISRGG